MVFNAWIPFILFEQKKTLITTKVCENKQFFSILTSSEDTKIIEYHQQQKSDKAPFIFQADLE